MNSSDRKQFQGLVQAAMGQKKTHRYRVLEKNLTAASTITIPLLTADDDPDFDAGGDFTTACECEQGARIQGIDLNLHIKPGGAGKAIEWMLWKNPDELISTTVNPSALFTNDLDATTVILRKYVMAYGMIVSSSTMEAKPLHIRISRAAMRRAGTMSDNDVLRLNVANAHASTAGVLHAYGRIWTRK